MRLAAFGVFAILCLLLASTAGFAQTSEKELLVGKWEGRDKLGDMDVKILVEFTKDTLKVSFEMTKFEGKYKWLDKDNIEVCMTSTDGKEMTEKTRIMVTKDELVVTGKDNKPAKFTRVK